MGTPNDITLADWALKENYDAETAEAAFKRKRVFMSRIKTRGNIEGNPMKVPLKTSYGGGVSVDFASAQSGTAGLQGKNFMVEPADLYGVVQLNHKLQLVSGKVGSFVKWAKSEIDAKFEGMGIVGSSQLFGDGGGSVGRGASVNSNTITLTSAADAINFWEGVQIESSVNDGTGVGHTKKTGFATVTAVDRDNGTVTVDNIAGISGFAGTDWLFIRGAFAGNVTQKLVAKGLRAWFPLAAPSDTLWGLTRTGNPMLSGFRLPAASQTGGVVERIKRLSTHGFTTFNSTAALCPLHPKQWEQASISLSNQAQRIIRVNETATIAGYSKLEVVSQAAVIDLISDPHCPLLQTWLIDEGSCYIEYSGDDLCGIYRNTDTDSMFFTSPTTMGEEVRLYSYFNFVSEAPWLSGTTALSAPPA